ncbi:hypothetical protein [Streptomyces chryseus]|uniref:Transposase n=1 Tax=Streptomyces chryseus TaxID=68186 RepID=A0ABQ3DJ61_9ACTN|nr:hypothetical protein [Streptomyces chryseus]GHA96581.1 hypothetical protein GCM10010346_19190 [Streptomyces chryseus]
MTTDLDSLATALYAETDDLLKGSPQLAPWQPAVGTAPKLTDAELVTLAMMQAMLGFTSEARWLRHARSHLRHLSSRPGQTLLGDKSSFGRDFEHHLAEQDIRLLRPARKGEPERPGAPLFKPLRQVVESVNETFKGQLDLEQHRGRTPGGVIARVMQRLLALTAAIWHNDYTGQPVLRSLTAYDH